jgi:L-ascorbate metabolism protein UlaG (beta-lactamase superfamily)
MARFPITDHCDGERFFNPHGLPPRSFSDLPKWWWQRARGAGASWPNSVPPTPARLPATVPAGHVAATLLGHATWLLQFPGLTVLTDPVFATHAGPFGLLGPKRVQPAALRLGELPRIDVVLLSHNHYDHLDLSALRWLTRHRQPAIIAPLGLKAWLEERGVAGVAQLDWWESRFPQAGVEVTCTPAQHWSSRAPWDRCRTLWGGFMLRTAAGAVYFGGDSGWGPHFAEIPARLGRPGLALLPIGAYEPRWFMEPVHMNPAEAVRAHQALGATRSLGMHHQTWNLTDEGYDAPAQDLVAARAAAGLVESAFVAPTTGETILVRL